MIDGESEYLSKTKVLALDELDDKSLSKGSAESLKKSVMEMQNPQFTDIMIATFGWKIQSDKSRKLVSKLPNGKILFPDRSESKQEIEPGIPYVCLVYEREREAFAKICAEEYQPKIYIHPSKMVAVVWRKKNGDVEHKVPVGNSYNERLLKAFQIVEDEGFPSIRVVIRRNQRP